MQVSQLLAYLDAKVGAQRDYPFDDKILVFKVRGKMFALLDPLEVPPRVNLKCDPAEAQMLRDIFPCVLPGYHMNKRHWNTLVVDGSLPDGEVRRMIDNSYALVVKGLKVSERKALALLATQSSSSAE